MGNLNCEEARIIRITLYAVITALSRELGTDERTIINQSIPKLQEMRDSGEDKDGNLQLFEEKIKELKSKEDNKLKIFIFEGILRATEQFELFIKKPLT